MSLRSSQLNRYKKIISRCLWEEKRGHFHWALRTSRGTGRKQVARAGRASREMSRQGREHAEVWGPFNSDGAEEMYKRIQRNYILELLLSNALGVIINARTEQCEGSFNCFWSS